MTTPVAIKWAELRIRYRTVAQPAPYGEPASALMPEWAVVDAGGWPVMLIYDHDLKAFIENKIRQAGGIP